MGNYHPHGDSADLRHPGPDGPAVVAALPAGRRQRQLRLAGQRPAGRHAVHRVPARRRWRWRCCATSTRTPSTSARTTTAGPGADDPAGPVPEPAGQRLRGHRGRHGHQDPAAQPARDRRRRAVGLDHPEATDDELLDALLRAGQGAGLPDRRADRRPRRASRRRTAPAAARSGCARWSRSRRTSAAAPAWSSPSCRTRSTRTTSPSDRRAGQGGQARRHRRHPRRVQRPYRPCGWCSCSSATRSPRSC